MKVSHRSAFSTPVAVPVWPAEVTQLLEEHHLVAWSMSERRRNRFAADLVWHMSQFEDTQVVRLHGARIHDLESFCGQLARELGLDRVALRPESVEGVVGALRQRATEGDLRPLKRRFIVWDEADVLLRADPRLFGRLTDAIAGVAAEAEFTTEDLLFLQRLVFVGGPALDVYAEDPRGQCRSWWAEGSEDPLWRVITGLPAPVFLRYEIGDEVDA